VDRLILRTCKRCGYIYPDEFVKNEVVLDGKNEVICDDCYDELTGPQLMEESLDAVFTGQPARHD